MEAFLVAFVLAFLSELVDKTQLVIFSLALKHRSPWKVFAGALSAHAVMDGLAVILGLFVHTLDLGWMKYVVGGLFIIIGVRGFFKQEDAHKKRQGYPFMAAFLTILLSEFGDKTQFASGLISAQFGLPWQVFGGILIALALAIGVNVFVGRKLAERVPAKLTSRLASGLFVVFGIVTMFL